MHMRHTPIKLCDRISTRKGKALYEELFKKYNIEGLTFQDKLIALAEHIQSHDGVKKVETEESLDGEMFDCSKLCSKFRGCTSNAISYLEEIKTLNCYVSRYPYEWTTPDGRTVRVCKYMIFPKGFPHDAENPYPKCIHPKPLVHLERDRLVRNPEVCWTCYKLQKKAREEKIFKRAVRYEAKSGVKGDTQFYREF